MDDFEEIAKQKEFERFEQAIGAESDPIMRVLRAHLFSENLIERLLTIKLPGGHPNSPSHGHFKIPQQSLSR